MTPELQTVLADHEAWLSGDASKIRADLTRTNLRGASLSHAELSFARLGGANLSGADLRGADLTRAKLSFARLSFARLGGADLSGADLTRAELSFARLGGANLSGANLSGADLSGADLTGAKGIASEPEEITLLLRIRDIILSRPDRLCMRAWHGDGWSPEPEMGDCGTTHCLAGWAQALSTDPEVRKLDPSVAGSRLLPRHARLFYHTEETVLKVLRNLPE